MLPTPLSDPRAGNVTLLALDGITPIGIPISVLDFYYSYAFKSSLNYGAQMGGCIVMFFVLVVLTKPGNCRKPVYILNLLSLLSGVFRAYLSGNYFFTPWLEFYSHWAGDFSQLPTSAYASSVAGIILPLLMTITVTLSLGFQANTVCKAMDRKWYIPIVGVSVLVAIIGIGFRFAQSVIYIIAVVNAVIISPSVHWVESGCSISDVIVVWWFSAIFIGKLLYTMYARRNLGLAPWSPMQILMVMSGCTMAIPSIFVLLAYFRPYAFPASESLPLTMVALLLPLSSLWASTTTTRSESTFNITRMLASSSSSSTSATSKDFKSGISQTSHSSATTGRKGSKSSYTITHSETIGDRSAMRTRDSTELDLEAMGVRIERSYSIHSEK